MSLYLIGEHSNQIGGSTLVIVFMIQRLRIFMKITEVI